jgi:acetoin utilization protein AcuC
MQMRVYHGAELGAYGFPNGHPFGTDRLGAFWREFLARSLDRDVMVTAPVRCTREDLLRFHTPDYVELVERRSAEGIGFLDHGDTPAFPEVYRAACYVVGSVLDAGAAIMQRRCRRAFVPIAGLHHAQRGGAAGFCVFNDIGVLVEYLRAEHGLHRIAYVDIDAHHGDGVYYGFEDDPHLLFADIHEDGRYLYPGTGTADETGAGAATGTKLNIPLPPEADDDAFRTAWTRVEDFVRRGNPQFVILQAGADSIDGDPLTHMRFSPAAHGFAAARLAALADELCEGRLLATGGGGYNRDNLAQAWCNVVQNMSVPAR